jgi:Family of unknown function (DUF6261)
MIISADLHNYRNGEFIQFLRTNVNKCNELDANILGISTQVDDLQTKTNAMDGLYMPQTGSSITPEVRVLDQRRDKAIVGIRTVALGYSSHFEEPKRQAGKNILDAIDHYGTGISGKNYVEETTILRAIVNDFENQPQLVNNLNLLNINDWVVELKTANNQFEAIYESRINETATQITSLENYRIECQAAYRTLVNHINSHAVLTPSVNINLLISRINQTITQYNLIVSNRMSSGEEEIEEQVG